MIMLDTNHCLSFETSPMGSPPMGDDMEKAGLKMEHDRHVYHSLKEGGQSGAKLNEKKQKKQSYLIWFVFMYLSGFIS